MSVVILLLPLALLLAFLFLGAFIIAVDRGQYDDTETPSHRMLLDDFKPVIPIKKGNSDE